MTAIDRAALAFAERVVARQPRGDYTIAELPPAVVVGPTDLVPIWHNGQTYSAQASLVAGQDVDGWVNVVSYGAKGTGATDDSGAIQLALAAAVAGGSTLYFPPGRYLYNSPIPLTIPYGVVVLAFGDAQIIGGALSTDCFVYTSTQIIPGVSQPGIDFLPAILNFYNGAAVRIHANERTLWSSLILGCYYGVLFESMGGTTVYYNTVTVHQINGCVYGVTHASDAVGLITGNVINVNNIFYCPYAIAFLPLSGATTYAQPFAVFNVTNISNGGAIGGIVCGSVRPAPWYGIYSPASLALSNYVINVQGSFGPFIAGWIGVSTPAHTNVEYSLNINNLPIIQLAAFGTLAPFSRVTFITEQVPAGVFPLPATGGGVASQVVTGNAVRCSITWVSGAAAGGVIDGYGYALGVTGDTPIAVSLDTTAPVAVLAAVDETKRAGAEGAGPTPFQFHIRLIALGTIAANTVITMMVKIGP